MAVADTAVPSGPIRILGCSKLLNPRTGPVTATGRSWEQSLQLLCTLPERLGDTGGLPMGRALAVAGLLLVGIGLSGCRGAASPSRSYRASDSSGQSASIRPGATYVAACAHPTRYVPMGDNASQSTEGCIEAFGAANDPFDDHGPFVP